ncbi:MAG TPA: shikimate dehydrogenase, partial [Lysobacter sp.]
GAAAGVAPALLDAGVAVLAIRNRSSARSSALATRLGDARVQALAWDASDEAAFDVVINSTSAARSDAAIDWPLPRARTGGWAAVDLGYGRDAAMFLDAARAQGAAACLDGLGMLVEQAAESFRLWHGVMPDTAPVYDLLRRELPAP